MNNESWYSLRKESHREIMNTDILCEISFPDGQEEQAVESLDAVFSLLREFEAHYSRFKKDNDLWHLNESESLAISQEFFNILKSASYFHRQTGGLFDPSILPALEEEGYRSEPYKERVVRTQNFSTLTFDPAMLSIQKPKDLLIDLGGIGKGYAVDLVVTFLSQRFAHFLIDAGGDIYVRGTNRKEGYPYWAIAVEHPLPEHEPSALLLLKDMAVATSGRNRRHWKKNGLPKHHLIDPETDRSAQTDYLSVTVVAGSTVSADVLAKTLFIAGSARAPFLADRFHIPAIFVDTTGTVTINHFMRPYVWQA